MTREEQREIWAIKMRNPEMRNIPDAVFYVIMERAKHQAILQIKRAKVR